MFFDFSLVQGPGLLFWLAGVLAVLVVAISKSGFGGALGSLSAPILILVMPPKAALAVLLPVFLITDFFVVWKWRHYGVRRLIWLMIVFAVLGQVLGWLLFKFINDQMLVALIGLVSLITALNYCYKIFWPKEGAEKKQRLRARQMRQKPMMRAALWCGLSGFSSFVSLTGGILAQVFMLPMRLPRRYYVGTMVWYFLLINLGKFPFFIELGMFNMASLTLSLMLLPVLPVGVALGLWMNKTMSDRLFYHISHLFLGVLGLRLLAPPLIQFFGGL